MFLLQEDMCVNAGNRAHTMQAQLPVSTTQPYYQRLNTPSAGSPDWQALLLPGLCRSRSVCYMLSSWEPPAAHVCCEGRAYWTGDSRSSCCHDANSHRFASVCKMPATTFQGKTAALRRLSTAHDPSSAAFCRGPGLTKRHATAVAGIPTAIQAQANGVRADAFDF